MMRFLSMAFSIVVAAGCGGTGDPAHFSVSGTVTLDNKPLSGADVAFIPTGNTQGIGAEGRTGADGRYQLTNRRGKPGTEAGSYKVTISKRVMRNGTDVPADDKTPPIESPARESLPPIYSSADRTILKAIVSEKGGAIDFPLTKGRR